MEAKSHLLLLLVSVAAAMPAPAPKNDNRRGRSEASKSDVDFVVVLLPTNPMEGKIDVAELLKKARDTMHLMRQSQQQKPQKSQPQRQKFDQQPIKQTQQFDIQALETELPEIDPKDLEEGQKLAEMFEQSMAQRQKHKEVKKLEADNEEDKKLQMRQSQQQKPQKSQPQRQKFDQQPIKQTQQFDIQALETELPEIDPKDLEEGQKLMEMFEQSMAQRQKHKEVKKLEADNEEDNKLQMRLSQQQKNDQIPKEQSQREQHKHDQVALIEPESPETETLEIEPQDNAEGKKVMELFEKSLAQRQKQKRLKKLKEEQPVLTRGYFTEVMPDSPELAGALDTDESQEAEMKSGELLEEVMKMAEESPQIAIQVAEESPQTVVQIAEESHQATTQLPEESPLTSMAPSIKKLKEEDWPEELFPCPPGEQRDADGNCDEIRKRRARELGSIKSSGHLLGQFTASQRIGLNAV
ncbi:mRNA export factor GLE1-like [Schistocerca serialis cubense]|uniref:mRNA export factor GLE1-like n=1 Tax=Schistocerca serialis cubense TaxID=2023355 RepID=UPI00214E724A|nr:mRNA export factor GLE1-like [Schistocerca serialis cubense]